MQDKPLSFWQKWYLAARPKTLWAAVGPVILGTALAYADGYFHWPSALAALLIGLLIQIGANFANDYFDFVNGADTHDRLGPMRLTQAGHIAPETMKKAFVLVFALAFLAGLYLIWRGGWPVLMIGLLSILFAVLYTGGPVPLGYIGLGDFLAFLFFGPVAVAGTYYVQALTVTGPVLIAGFGPGFLSAAILIVNNFRDRETDKQTGKHTLAVRFGPAFSRFEYVLMILLATLVPVYLWLNLHQHAYAMATLLIFIPAFPLIKTMFRHEGGVILNDVLAGTGKLMLIYSLIFSVGWLL